ncbi:MULTISPECIES: amino acid ABC transporter permease [Aromatoleum]|uniref:ABC transporter permease subunit n=2 Tax=Aromatoleum TaxID=551759 RepID=A0ABX1NRA3_9RHOO|nr:MULTISPECIES: amino acid ABC transporter permease [Aromatoleum]MCK0509044.1 amino acid ABC transporter permease [Aromatoleum anaerobium]NMG14499.1 ABC transporter permease subunit [Aromatoleum bremense]QTQ30835.1 Glutamate/aspartate transport system permease protein [Aromatoleum bremense]
MDYHWDWLFFFRETDDGLKYYDWILSGLGWTTLVSLASLALALALGSALGVMRTTPKRWLVAIGDAYVDVFRNIPLIVQLFMWFFVVPELVPDRLGMWMKQDLPYVVIAVVGLGLYTAARIAEQVKAGINSLSRGQRNAGLALGLTEWQTYRHVRLPMAYRIVLPAMTSEAMNIFKNSAVTYAVGILELYFQYKQIIEKTSQVLEITIVVTLAYFALAFLMNRLLAFIERRTRVPGLIVGGKGSN